MTKQKAFLLMVGPDGDRGLNELNFELGRGWRVVATSPLGGAATGSSKVGQDFCVGALVIIERGDRYTDTISEAVEEESMLDDIVDGDGADVDADI